MLTADITFLDLLKMVYDDTQPSEVRMSKNVYRWQPVQKDYYNISTGYSLCAEMQQIIPFEVVNLVSKKILNYDREILTNDEKDYLSGVLYPYIEIIDNVQKIPIEQKEKADYRLVIQFTDGNPNLLLPSFPYDAPQYVNMRPGQKYSLEDLKLYDGLLPRS